MITMEQSLAKLVRYVKVAPLEAENWANAYLIAASPDMYEALTNLLDFYERGIPKGNGATQPARDAARAALARASGLEGEG